MIWVLGLHILTLLIWLASVLYVPLLIAAESKDQRPFNEPPFQFGSVARMVFIYVSVPAAIIAITAGTVVFMLNNSAEFWLVVKLTLVTVLTILHASLGLLIARLERQQMQYLALWSRCLLVALMACAMGIIWIVLAKPAVPEFIPWPF